MVEKGFLAWQEVLELNHLVVLQEELVLLEAAELPEAHPVVFHHLLLQQARILFGEKGVSQLLLQHFLLRLLICLAAKDLQQLVLQLSLPDQVKAGQDD